MNGACVVIAVPYGYCAMRASVLRPYGFSRIELPFAQPEGGADEHPDGEPAGAPPEVGLVEEDAEGDVAGVEVVQDAEEDAGVMQDEGNGGGDQEVMDGAVEQASAPTTVMTSKRRTRLPRRSVLTLTSNRRLDCGWGRRDKSGHHAANSDVAATKRRRTSGG